MNTVTFPLFGIALNIDRIAFTIGTKTVYWYGIIIACGLLAGLLLSLALSKKYDNISKDNIYDIVLWGAPSAIICARLYYVIFSLDEFESFSDVFKIWEGGIAIYGAIIGAFISTFIYCRKKNLNLYDVLDVCSFGLILGQIIGRWGNFVNVEAFGYETNVPWRMEIMLSGTMTGVHPTFLYESLWNTVGLIIMLIIRNKTKFKGEVFTVYALWYGLGRAWIEGLRTDSLYLIGNLRISQLIAIIAVIAGAYVLIKNHFISNKKTDL